MNSLRNTIKRFLFAVSFICVLSALWGQTPPLSSTYTWTGQSDTSFTNPVNWNPPLPPSTPLGTPALLIPAAPTGGRFPELKIDSPLPTGTTVTVEEGAELDLGKYRFIEVPPLPPLMPPLNPDNADITITVKGTLKLAGTDRQKTLFELNMGKRVIELKESSTVQYNPGSSTDPVWKGPYEGRLIINRTVQYLPPLPPPSPPPIVLIEAKKSILINETALVTYDGPLTIKAPQIQIGSGPAGSGGVATKNSALTLEGDTYLGGNSAMLYAGTGVIVQGNVFAATQTLRVPSSLTCRENFVLYKGIIRFTSGTTDLPDAPVINITADKDLILLGPAYAAADAETGTGDLFAYNNARRTAPAPSLGALFDDNRTFPDGTSVPSSGFTGRFELTGAGPLSGKTLKAGKNFYANGIDLQAGAGWTLDIPSSGAFAEAYNVKVKNCTVKTNNSSSTAFVTAGERCTDGGGNSSTTGSDPRPHWDFKRPEIKRAYTVSDNTVYIEFSEPIKNTGNEISAAISHIKLAGTAVTAFTNKECTISTNGAGNLSSFYLKSASTWNTDATGTFEGDADSTDRSGVHQGVKVDLTILKALKDNNNLTDVYATLQDTHNNRIKHYDGTTLYTGTEDNCPPVLIGVYTGREEHTPHDGSSTTGGGQPYYDAHNFIEFRYSEPVALYQSDSAADTAEFIPAPASPPSSPENVRAISAIGNITAQGGGIKVAGFVDKIDTGKVETGSREVGSSPSVIVHSLYRTLKKDRSTAATYQRHRVRLSIAGYVDIAQPKTINGKQFNNWVGYIKEAQSPSGAVTQFTENKLVRSVAEFDPDGPLGPLPAKRLPAIKSPHALTVTDTGTMSDFYGKWDTSAPVFAKAADTQAQWANSAHKKKEIAAFSATSNFADKTEFHFFDNTPAYNSTEAWWKTPRASNTEPGWSDDGTHNRYDLRGGIRASSLPTPTEVGAVFAFTADTPAFNTALQKFKSTDPAYIVSITQKAENAALFGLPPSTQSPWDTPYMQLKITSTNPFTFPVAENFKVAYTSRSSSSSDPGVVITDLAGNMMKNTLSGYNESIAVSPPTIALTVAPVGSKKMFILFSCRIQTGPEVLRKIPKNLELANVSTGLAIDENKPVVVRTDTENATGIIVSLNQAVQFKDVIAPAQVKVKDGPSSDPAIYIRPVPNGVSAFAGHKHVLSDFAVNVVRPLFAFDEKVLPDGSKGFLKKGLYGGESPAVRLFDGSGAPGNTVSAQSDVTLNVAVDVPANVPSDMPKHGDFKLYISNAPEPASVSTEFNRATGLQSRVWFPRITNSNPIPPPVFPPSTVPQVPAISAQSNGNFTALASAPAASPPQNPYVFKLDLTQPPLNYAAGTTASFLFPLIDSAGAFRTIDHDLDGSDSIPLYALRLKDPNDPASIDLWSLNIGAIKEQAGGVSILNNVINTSTGESTLIEIKTGSRGSLNVVVMSLDGDVIKVLHSGRTEAGTHLFKWNGTNKRGEEVARGLYFIRVTAPGIDETRKVMAVRE